jgi:hypothetical protein
MKKDEGGMVSGINRGGRKFLQYLSWKTYKRVFGKPERRREDTRSAAINIQEKECSVYAGFDTSG